LDSEKAEALADSLQAQLHPVKNRSEPAIIEVVNEAMRAYALAPGNMPQLTNPAVVQDATRRFKFGKAPRPNGVTNRALKYLPLSVLFPPLRVIQLDLSILVFPAS
jgi:hypothetical protein